MSDQMRKVFVPLLLSQRPCSRSDVTEQDSAPRSLNRRVAVEINPTEGRLHNPTEGRHHNPTEGRLGNPTEGRPENDIKALPARGQRKYNKRGCTVAVQ